MQRAIIIYFFSEKKNNLDELNKYLSEGWKVISQSPMSGCESNASTSLVIIEK